MNDHSSQSQGQDGWLNSYDVRGTRYFDQWKWGSSKEPMRTLEDSMMSYFEEL